MELTQHPSPSEGLALAGQGETAAPNSPQTPSTLTGDRSCLQRDSVRMGRPWCVGLGGWETLVYGFGGLGDPGVWVSGG